MSILGVVAAGVNSDTMANETKPVFRTTLFRSFTPHEWTHLPDGWNPDWASYAECSCVLGGLNYARLYAKPPGWTGPWNPPATKPPAPAAPPVVSGY